MFGLGQWEIIAILLVVLVLFGPKRLPQLGKSIGKTMRAIREGADGKAGEEDDDEAKAAKTDAAAKPKKAATADNADAEDEE